MRSISKTIAFAALAMLFAQPGFAACKTSTIAGKWNIYTTGTVAGQVFWVHCHAVLRADGTVNEKSSVCRDIAGTNSKLKGSFKVIDAALCTYSGKGVLTGSKLKINIDEATLD